MPDEAIQDETARPQMLNKAIQDMVVGPPMLNVAADSIHLWQR